MMFGAHVAHMGSHALPGHSRAPQAHTKESKKSSGAHPPGAHCCARRRAIGRSAQPGAASSSVPGGQSLSSLSLSGSESPTVGAGDGGSDGGGVGASVGGIGDGERDAAGDCGGDCGGDGGGTPSAVSTSCAARSRSCDAASSSSHRRHNGSVGGVAGGGEAGRDGSGDDGSDDGGDGGSDGGSNGGAVRTQVSAPSVAAGTAVSSSLRHSSRRSWTERLSLRVAPDTEASEAARLEGVKRKALRSQHELMKQSSVWFCVYLLLLVTPFAWPKAAYLSPLPLHAYNVLTLRTLAVYTRGTVRPAQWIDMRSTLWRRCFAKLSTPSTPRAATAKATPCAVEA
mmetsp:Transcript_27319/g.73450  ORF Transcript_27319/g.73450 Transcript_27319/m.73450 type:complete len:341 (-) Transcript_27319:545-1567(-)